MNVEVGAKMNYISLFSGIEAASVAWESLGWKPVVFADVEPFACAVLKHHYPDVPNVGDVTAYDWWQYHGQVDVMIGGPPCQAFSVAGLRESLQDDRGNLSLAWARAINAVNPGYAVTENVPGWLSTSDNAFGCFLGAVVGADAPLVASPKHGRWPNAGMVVGPNRTAAWRVLDAQHFGLAQRRKRVFVVICPRGGANPAAVLFESNSLSRHTSPRKTQRQDIANCLVRGSGSNQVEDTHIPFTPSGRANYSRGVGTLRANGGDIGGGSETIIAFNGRQYPVSGEVTGALDTDPLTQCICLQQNASGELRTGDVCGTLSTNSNASGRNTPMIAATVTAKWAKGTGGPSGDECQNLLAQHLQVRRLLPVEAERLQGFPDGYTAIPYRGKPASDGPRYKALGNSMAVPVIKWIGERIQMVEEIKQNERT